MKLNPVLKRVDGAFIHVLYLTAPKPRRCSQKCTPTSVSLVWLIRPQLICDLGSSD